MIVKITSLLPSKKLRERVTVYLCQARIRLPTLALKPRGDITRSRKQGYQWPHKKDLFPIIFFFLKRKSTSKFNIVSMGTDTLRDKMGCRLQGYLPSCRINLGFKQTLGFFCFIFSTNTVKFYNAKELQVNSTRVLREAKMFSVGRPGYYKFWRSRYSLLGSQSNLYWEAKVLSVGKPRYCLLGGQGILY